MHRVSTRLFFIMTVRRIFAFGLDYLIIISYAGLLFGLVQLVGIVLHDPSPWLGQLIGFVSLTLPVMLYFTLMENGQKQGTLGKRALHLRVLTENEEIASLRSLLLRNVLKFLPWEMAHFGIHWTFFYSRQEMEMPLWLWVPLILSQVLVLIFLGGMVANRQGQTLYELLSHTRVFRAQTV
jgi:uncharacterized RDD family membrane protein YckC